jgi:hypothetical protein
VSTAGNQPDSTLSNAVLSTLLMLHFVVLSQLQPYAVVVVSHLSYSKFAPFPSQIALGPNAAQNS